MSSNLGVFLGPRGAFQIILCSQRDVSYQLCPQLKQSGIALFLIPLQRTAKFPTGSVVASAGIVVGIATAIP